jgi:hypothetical protein
MELRYNVLDPANLGQGIGVPQLFETTAVFGYGNAATNDTETYAPGSWNAPMVPIMMD